MLNSRVFLNPKQQHAPRVEAGTRARAILRLNVELYPVWLALTSRVRSNSPGYFHIPGYPRPGWIISSIYVIILCKLAVTARKFNGRGQVSQKRVDTRAPFVRPRLNVGVAWNRVVSRRQRAALSMPGSTRGLPPSSHPRFVKRVRENGLFPG